MSRSSTTMSRGDLLPNPHPGEILLEEFLKPMGLSQNALARATLLRPPKRRLRNQVYDSFRCLPARASRRRVHVPPRRINEIVLGKRAVTADTDLRLARYFGLSEGVFLGLQADYDLMERRRVIANELRTIAPRAA